MSSDSGIVASTIGTAPRSPAQDRKACSRSGTLNQTAETTDRHRPGDEGEEQPGREGDHDGLQA